MRQSGLPEVLISQKMAAKGVNPLDVDNFFKICNKPADLEASGGGAAGGGAKEGGQLFAAYAELKKAGTPEPDLIKKIAVDLKGYFALERYKGLKRDGTPLEQLEQVGR